MAILVNNTTRNRVFSTDAWSEFRKLLDGTYYNAAFIVDERTSYYRVIAEGIANYTNEIVINKDGGADVLDFEANFKALAPRLSTVGAYTEAVRYTRPLELPTFTVLAQGVAPGNNKSLLAIHNNEAGVLVRVHAIYIVNVQSTSITGVVGTFQVNRIGSMSAGTVISKMASCDTQDTLQVGITARTGATVASEVTPPFWKAVFSTDDWGPGTLDVEAHNHIFQTMFPVWKKQDPLCKDLLLRENEGLSVKFATNSNVGSFDIMMVFSQETI